MPPILSVIVPVYKVEPYLRQCVDSILAQSYPHLEVILIDDGSPDNCGAICDQYSLKDTRIRVYHQANAGQAAARNAGLLHATGEYITFVDSDDWLDEGLYEKLMVNAPFQMQIFGCTTVDESKNLITAHTPIPSPCSIKWESNDTELRWLFASSLFGYAVNKIYHRSVLVGLTFQNIKLREDLLFALEAGRRVKQIHTSQSAGYFYRIHSQSTLHGTYSGLVPDIVYTSRLFLSIHPELSKRTNRIISNDIIKTYIIDALYKFVFLNSSLSKKARATVVRELVIDSQLRRHLFFQRKDNALFFLLTLSFKLRSHALLYFSLKRIWGL